MQIPKIYSLTVKSTELWNICCIKFSLTQVFLFNWLLFRVTLVLGWVLPNEGKHKCSRFLQDGCPSYCPTKSIKAPEKFSIYNC